MILSTLLVLVTTVSTSTVPSSFVLHEKRSIEPATSQWIKRDVAPRDTIIPVRIALTQRDPQDGHAHLMDISNPESPNFGRHWTAQQVHDFFSPTSETISSVRDWLSSSGIAASRHRVANSRGHIRFDASVAEVEQLLATDYHLWEHAETGVQTLSCDSYHVPIDVHNHIDFITPTTGLALSSDKSLSVKKRHVADDLAEHVHHYADVTDDNNDPQKHSDPANKTYCSNKITPDCIRHLYGIPATAIAVPGNELGIPESVDAYDQEDLDLFFTTFAKHIPNGTAPVLQSIDGGIAPVSVENGGDESTLDFELAYPIIYPQGIKLFQTLDPSTAASPGLVGLGDIFLDALDASFCTYDGGNVAGIDPEYPNAGYNGSLMCGTYKTTNVLSISYSIAEAFYPKNYTERQCYEYMKLGLQGSSIIFASGDNGTVERGGVYGCLADGHDNPSFPASCPYVTSVGATQIAPGKTAKDREVAVDPKNVYSFSSGGGFSNVFQRPSYQDNAVKSWSKHSTRNASLFNAAGRGFPDVSANGWNIATFWKGKEFLNSGTSASAPIFASIINRINGDRILAGKKPVGFLNPILYAHPHIFRDVTEGYNLGCNAAVGFNATKGWDPVTGLGTPMYEELHKLLLNLP